MSSKIIPYLGKTPRMGQDCFVAPDAWIIGDTSLADEVSVFFGAVLRGDILPIQIGRRSNIQERVIIHTSNGRKPTIVGEECTIGHGAILHGCEIRSRVLIGMGATILDEAIIGEESVIGAGSLVTEGKHIPPRSLVVGVPGKVVRELRDEEIQFLRISAERYVQVGKNYRAMNLG